MCGGGRGLGSVYHPRTSTTGASVDWKHALPRVELVPSHFSTSHSILAQVRSRLMSHPSGWAWRKQVQEGLSGPLRPSTTV